MSKTLKDLQADHAAKLADVNRLYDEIGDAPPDEAHLAAVKDGNKALEEIEHAIVEARGKAQEWTDLQAAQRARAEMLQTPVSGLVHPGETPTNGRKDTAPQTLGDLVLNSPEFKEWRANGVRGDQFLPSAQRIGHSPSVPLPRALKDLITGASVTSGGAMTVPMQAPLVALPFRPLTIRDIITTGTTNSDTVEYPRVTGYTNNAAGVAEATATSGGSGVKPESALALERVTTSVKTIAHWVPATRRALADAGQLRTLINSFLLQGLEEELEDEIVAGDGTNDTLLGLEHVTGTLAMAYTTDLLTTARSARTKVRVTGRAIPTAYLFHPNDWQIFDLLQDNENRYFFGGPMVLGTPRLWGLNVVESEAVTEHQGWVGDFRTIVLWDREQAQIMVSDSHSDFFIRNLVAILAEMRAALGFFRPPALCSIDLTA